MKIFRATVAVAFLAAICVGVAQAQQPRPGTTTTTPTTGTAPTVNVPETKIALVNSDEFQDEKGGIVRLVNAMKKVDVEFTPRRTELQTLQQTIEKATADLAKVGPMQSAQINQQQQEKIDQILAKVSAQGMQSLTWREKRTLKKATERQRQRDLELSRGRAR